MRRFYIFFLVLLALSSSINTVNAAVVSVPDDVLADALRQTLNLAENEDITDTALESLTVLSTTTLGETDPRIADLTGLEFAINLMGVSLIGHEIFDLQPLTTWTSINRLNLGGNSIVDLGPLKDLDTLTDLYLDNNQIVDVSPLAGLTNLTGLTLSGNGDLVNTSPLAWLPLTNVDVDIPLAVRINDAPKDVQSGAFDVTIEFSEDVTGFESVEIELTAGTASASAELLGSGAVYTATITPESDGEVVIQVPANVAVDDYRENNIASPEYPVSVDVPPQVTEIGWPSFFVDLGDRWEYHTPPTQVEDILVRITFSEDVTDFESDDIELLGTLGTATTATIESLTGRSDSEYDLTIGITPTTDGTGDGTLGIRILEGAVQDVSSGNDNIAYSTGDSDRAVLFAPTLEIVVPEEPQNDFFDVQFVFNELVTGFTQGWVEGYFDSDSTMDDIGGTLTGWDENATGTVYTATITPTLDGVFPGFRFALAQAPAVNSDGVKVLQNVFSSGSVIIDLTPPAVTIESPSAANAAFEVTITFGEDEDEDVTGFEADDILLTGSATATVTDWSVSGAAYTAEITPTADGDLVIQVPADVAVDAAGNGNTESQSHTVTVDVSRPSVNITNVPTTVNAPFDVTITFTEDVTGFDSFTDDISFSPDSVAVQGTISSVNQREYTATFTPQAEGNVIFSVAADAAEDAATNLNTASESHTVQVDLTRPSIDTVTGVPDAANETPFDVTITFTEPVAGFQVDEIEATDEIYTATLTPQDPITVSGEEYAEIYILHVEPTSEGTWEFSLPAGIAQDESSNSNIASANYSVVFDFTPPTVTIASPSGPYNGTFGVDFTFNENVTGFTADDISLTGSATAEVSDLTGSGSGYTATITPATGADGDLTIQVPADVAFDGAGNGNTESQSDPVSVDLVRPTVVIMGVPPPPQTGPFEVTITFTEDVTDTFEADDIELTGTAPATVDSLTQDQNPLKYTAEITPTGNVGGNVVRIKIPADVARDAAGNGNIASLIMIVSLEWMPDKNLRDIVKEVLGLPVDEILTKDALLDLTVLDAAEVVLFTDDPKIADLTGLEYATELTELYLNEHAISDLRPLATLTQLTKLSLNYNDIEIIWHEDSDENPFADLTELTELSLNDNEIDDLSPLEPLTQLTKLSIGGNQIDDISALEPLTQLTELSLNLNQIDDITTLEALTQLTALSLNKNPIDDLMPLEGLTELTELSLNNDNSNPIEDIFFCAALTQLKILCLENNEISDVSPLAGLPNLEMLKLSGNPIDDTAPLIGIARRIEADEPIDALISDEELAEVLREREIFDLDSKEHITYADMRSLTTFEASDSDITDLSGLEHATELDTLDLRGNTIEDITPLKGLTRLTTLDLGFNSITDVTPLAGLVKLETLRLTGNPIQNANSLSNLTAHIEADIVVPGVIIDPALAVAIQETLDLPANTRILAEALEDLVSLNAQVGEIDTLAGLEHATHLTTLRIDAGSITDVTPLQALAALTTLEINSDALTVITPLQTLTQLTTLKLNGGAITDVTPLQTLTALTILELRDNTITDITALSELTALTTLDLSGNNINSIEALKVLTGLTTLNLSGNSISSSSINRLQELTRLTTLNLSGNSISSIDRLQELTRLTTLNLSGNSISSIEALQVLTRLTTLNLSDNSISSIEALQGLTALTTLEFADNSLSSIDGLQALTALTTLNLSTNDLSDIQPLQGLTVLKQLSLMSNNINDVLSLAGLVNLEFLRLAGNPIMDTSPLFPLVTTYKLMDVDIEISQWAPWDVNQDGIVNAMDATLVTAAIGQTGGTIANSLTDVNDDGVVDRNDLLLVQEHLNTDAAGAPSTDTIVALLGLDTLKSLSRTSLESELNSLIAETDGSLKYQRAIKFLENFLLALRPNKTRLLANYPNPFNPETWIPYTLATVSAVQITIYDARGAVVRRLDLGHQREGYYTSRSRAAYWDGRNHVGERVASGIYFYELAADDISLLRKMVILK